MRSMSMPSAGDPLVCTVLDLETSGLDARVDRILQVAAVDITLTEVAGSVTAEQTGEWSTLVRLPRPWTRVGAREIHGITRRRLQRGIRLREAVAELDRRLEGRVAIAHNLNFDWAFLESAREREGLPASKAPTACTLEISRSLDPGRRRSHRLGDLCRDHDIPLINAHDALADARATAALVPILLSQAGGLGALQVAGDQPTS
jgi:DNA polymerase-3 subunit epsilon